MNALKTLLGTGFYSGYLPVAPGTFGSLAALIPIFFIVEAQIYFLLIIFTVLCSLVTLWLSPFFENKYGEDPGMLVIDEWAGQGLVFILIYFTGELKTDIAILITGFLLFRLFDILKPLGINRVQNLKGAAGILADDLLAGLYAFISLKTLILLAPYIYGMLY